MFVFPVTFYRYKKYIKGCFYMFKKSIILVVVLLLVATMFPLGASAASGSVYPGIIISPMWVFLGQTYNNIYINGSGNCYMSATLTAEPTVDSVAITNYLQKSVNGSWVTQGTWSVSDDDNSVSWQKSVVVSTGSYRLKCVFYAYQDGDYEYTTKYDYDSY